MQGAKDPDEFIKTYGRERFERLLKNSKTPVEFELDKLKAGLDLNDTGIDVYKRQITGGLVRCAGNTGRILPVPAFFWIMRAGV